MISSTKNFFCTFQSSMNLGLEVLTQTQEGSIYVEVFTFFCQELIIFGLSMHF